MRHEYKHIDEKQFDCKVCGKLCGSFSQLTLHSKLHQTLNHQQNDKHVKAKRYNCKACAKSFASRSELSLHSRSHSSQSTKVQLTSNPLKNLINVTFVG